MSLLSNAECGPSNALSTFSKHSQQDRTLQQDRWVPGSSRPQESFRLQEHAPDQAAFQRDAQTFFDQAKPPQGLPHDVFQRPPYPALPVAQPETFEQNWERRFQTINISSHTPPPGQLQQPLRHTDISSSMTSWHEEFNRFSPLPPSNFSYKPQVQHRLASMAESTGLTFHEPIQQNTQTFKDAIFDDEAFEQAFAEAESATIAHPPEPIPQEVAEEPKLSPEEEADRLAQTAGELFDRLQYERETDEKFRNSKFMALMQKLRDREVVVSGNEMVESRDVQHKE